MLSLKAKLVDLGVNVDALEASTIKVFRTQVGLIAVAAHNRWIQLAKERLGTSRDAYVVGLQQAGSFKSRKVSGEDVFDITLVGRMPNNFEFGMESFDMKTVRPGWLGGSKAKTGKDGEKYVVIPFRHSTTSKRFGYTGKAKAADLRSELKKTVRAYGLNRMIRTATGNVVGGLTTRVPPKAPVHSYLRGLTRVQKGTRGRTPEGFQRGSSQLVTWRIMSENSPASSWIHPGLKAANLLREVELFVNKEFDDIVKKVIAAT